MVTTTAAPLGHSGTATGFLTAGSEGPAAPQHTRDPGLQSVRQLETPMELHSATDRGPSMANPPTPVPCLSLPWRVWNTLPRGSCPGVTLRGQQGATLWFCRGLQSRGRGY